MTIKRVRMTVVLVLAALLTAPVAGLAHKKAGFPDGVGVDEHLGGFMPANAVFRDESGKSRKFGEINDRATILCVVYYQCPGVCTSALMSVAGVLDKVNMVPGRDYRVVALSVSPDETPAIARTMKSNFIPNLPKNFPPEAWPFLTGKEPAIRAVTGAAGIRYQKVGGEYAHPSVIVFLSPNGKIVRYMSGLALLPMDVRMALLESRAGQVSPTVRGALLYCFNYDPRKKTYAFNVMRVAGTASTAGVLLVVLVLVFARRRRG